MQRQIVRQISRQYRDRQQDNIDLDSEKQIKIDSERDIEMDSKTIQRELSIERL